jgi:hypothetical protein
LSLDGRYRTVYVPAEWEEPVRQWVQRPGEVSGILEQLSLLFLARLQNRER